jgi:LmbE family N-acetylglucosaminyl deacetylase
MRALIPTLAICLSSLAHPSLAIQQPIEKPGPDERYKADILLVVAHPDDETLISAYLARAILDQHKRVAVIYGTRGDGGGNMIGYEQAASLGAVREIEVRRALASFGVMNVWFLGAPDTPGQDVLRSLETWRHGAALDQVVRIVRLTRPEVMLTWLPNYVVGENHDDHQAAAVLATEAFDMAGNPTAFPEQVAAPRNRGSIGNLTEGLHPWQPKKIYYFSDASHTDFQDGKGPKYPTTDISPSRQVPYFRLMAEEATYHLTQRGVGLAAKEAIEKGDFHTLQEPTRFIFGRSLVASSVTADIFEGVKEGTIPFAPQREYFPAREHTAALELGGPWAFYSEFWRAHSIEHLARLTGPEAGARPDEPLHVPLLLHNDSGTSIDVKLVCGSPKGWSERFGSGVYRIAPHDTFPIDATVVPASADLQKWQQLTWQAESGGKQIGQVILKVFVAKGGLPQ